MKKIALVLAFIFMTSAVAHSGAHIAGKSIFDKAYKYRINTADAHIGHFYVKNARVSRKGNEKLKIEHTVHLESNIVKKFFIKYNEKTSLLSYNYDMEGFTYFFNFYIKDDLLTQSNQGAMTIYNKADNTFTVSKVTLDPLDDSVMDDGGEDAGHDDGHNHG